MKLRLSILLVFISLFTFAQTNSFHDTQGKLEISNSGQATFTLPIAMPPSLGNVGPAINLVYQSGVSGGIAGQGWNINSISTIARIAARRDIDGFQDGVDFDSNDKLALDGQRLLLVSGTYWADGSVYQTEIQSNTKIELKGSGTAMYFIVTAPDGSRSWYGNYGGMNATDLTAFYITRFEDTNGNFMTYHYAKPYNGSLCISEIKFNGNTRGLSATNSLIFTYDAAKRKEFAYVKGLKHEKLAILKKIEVKTNNLLFRRYEIEHLDDPKLGYQRVAKIQEYNGAGEAANPVEFEYDTTTTSNAETELTVSYQNNLDFNDTVLSGDFDGDGHLDFTTPTKAYTKLFQIGTGTVSLLNTTIDKRSSFTATTLSSDGKLNQFQSVVQVQEDANILSFNILNKSPDWVPNTGNFYLGGMKSIYLNNTGTGIGDNINCTIAPTYTKKSNEYLEGDFDGNGISEVIITSKINEVKKTLFVTESECTTCNYEIDFNNHKLYRTAPWYAPSSPNYRWNFNKRECVNLRGTCQVVGYVVLNREERFMFSNSYEYQYYYFDTTVKLAEINPWGPSIGNKYNARTAEVNDEYEIPLGITLNATKKCNDTYTDSGKNYYYLDLNPNSSEDLGSSGYSQFDTATTAYLEGKKFAMDFNGDGKADLLCVKPNGDYKLITLNKLTAAPWNQWELMGQGNIDYYSEDRQILFGDFNGDAKADIMLPTVGGDGCDQGCEGWAIYYSNPNPAGGAFFVKETHNIVDYWANSGSTFDTQVHFSNYYALDTNGDGKSDLVRVWRKYYKPKWTINDHNTRWTVETYINNIGNPAAPNTFELDYQTPCQTIQSPLGPVSICDHNSDNNWLPVPIVSTYKHHGINKELVMVQNQNNTVTYVDFPKDVAKDNLIARIKQSGGSIIDEIEYKSLESTGNQGYGELNEFYSSTNQYSYNNVTYPNVEIIRIPGTNLVSKIKNTAMGFTKYKDFKYRGFVVNMDGLGAIGFRKTARSGWYQSDADKRLWSVTDNDFTKRGAQFRTYTQLVSGGVASFNFSLGLPTDALSSSVNTYFPSTTVNGLYTLLLDKQTATDHQTNVVTEKAFEYLAPYNLQKVVTTRNLLGTTEQGKTTIDTKFDNNPSGLNGDYFIGRPTIISSTVEAYGDTKVSMEKITYAQNGDVIKTEKKPISENYYLTEEFEYNNYGNIIKKTISAPGSMPTVTPKVTEFVYDVTERFVTESKDIEQKVTKFEYDNLYGLVKKATNSFNFTSESFYDNWGKRTKVTDYLGKSIHYTYTKANNEYTTTQVGDEGSQSVVVSNALGQVIKTGTLLINGQWTYSSTEYDFLGRKKRSSEPYFSNESPSQWTAVTYDDLGRMVKTVEPSQKTTTVTYNGLTVSATDGIKTSSSTKNANGHTISTSDNGGQIIHTYYADGNTKTTSYDGTELKMEYDLWGRKTKLIDPSAGTYEYTYYPSGQSKRETTPNGYTEYEYDNSTGKILKKTVSGQNTDTETTYSYNSDGLLGSSSLKDTNNGVVQTITYNFDYDTYKRLYATMENGPHGFYQRVTLFDNYGRPEKEAYNAIVNGKQSAKWTRNTYLHGHHWQILDDASGAMLWQVDAVNQRNQITLAHYGNAVGQVANTYDIYGFPTQASYKTINGTNASATPFMALTSEFDPKRGNLLSRENSAFNIKEDFGYDSLDRLTTWQRSDQNLLTLPFNTTTDGFVFTGTALQGSVSNSAATLRVILKNTFVTAKRDLAFTVNIGDKMRIKTTVSGKTGSVVRAIMVETDPTDSNNYNEIQLGAINNGTFDQIYTVSDFVPNPKLTLKFIIPEDIEFEGRTGPVTPTSTFYIDNLTIDKVFLHTQEYDQRGKITQNNFGTYNYNNTDSQTGLTKQYQNSSLSPSSEGLSYYNTRGQLNVTYNAFKSPYTIEENGIDKYSFQYNDNNGRRSMFYGGLQTDMYARAYAKHYSMEGSMEAKVDNSTGNVEIITYIGGDAYSAPIIYKSNGTVGNYLYLHRDYLGSIMAVSNADGLVLEKRHFDAWGNAVKITDGSGNALPGLTVIDRGYTGHEHLQSVGLIHMNGRLYDPKLHRFMQPDNFVQDSSNTQNYNRYAYVLNNPLKYTDPSGEYGLGIAVVVAVAVAAVTYTITALVADVPFSANGLIQNCAIAAGSAVITFGIGSACSTIANFYVQTAVQAVAHGTFQGAMTAGQGGKFWSGFAAGCISSLASSAWSGGNTVDTEGNVVSQHEGFGAKLNIDNSYGMIAFGTVMGGAGASLTGGNFWQGAVTGLFVSAFNHAMHSTDNSSESSIDDSKQQQEKKSFESGLKKVLSKTKIGQKIESEDLVKLYGIPEDQASLINSFTKTSANTIKVDWVSSFNPKMALVNSLSDAKFNDGIIKISYTKNGTMKLSGDAIGIKFNGRLYFNLTITGNYATLPTNVTNQYQWFIGKKN